jgi:hypothetical protein
MVELKNDVLVFRFPEVHGDAVLRLQFLRTLRVPDDDREYPLPPGLGRFPMRHVDDFADRVPAEWQRRGGTVLPMYQSEAMWIDFTSPNGYPFAVKVAAGKINAITGESWAEGLSRSPQNYVAVPDQPWLDGYCVERDVIRQFVAMPLGDGYSAEEQLTGEAEHGGIQILVHPLKARHYSPPRHLLMLEPAMPMMARAPESSAYDMGLAPGGRMRQKIEKDHRPFSHWDLEHRGRCFAHLANSLVWRAITGEEPPTVPPTAAEYTRHGLPWFDYYGSDREALDGGRGFGAMKSVREIGEETGRRPLPENESVKPGRVVRLRRGPGRDRVREWGGGGLGSG